MIDVRYTYGIKPIKVALDDGAYMPTKAHDDDAGFDLYSPVDFTILPRDSAKIDTGVHVEIPLGHFGSLRSKSGLNVNLDVTSDGVIDCGYSGSIAVKLYNHSSSIRSFKRGEKISQLIIQPYFKTTLEQVENVSSGERGTNGFGSSGR